MEKYLDDSEYMLIRKGWWPFPVVNVSFRNLGCHFVLGSKRLGTEKEIILSVVSQCDRFVL